MEDILRPIYQERASLKSTLGILLIKKLKNDRSNTDAFDYVIFVVVNESEVPVFQKHYLYKELKVALHIVNESQLKEWLLLGSNRKVVNWIQNGRVIFDRNEYLEQLKKEMNEFPFHGRKLKMGIEFSKLIRRYIDGKAFFENGQFLDAFNHVVHSLHHLARLEVMEKGFYPEVTVWNQVKYIEPEIFKLYKELIYSDETLEKRLELLFIASEFLIYSRADIGSQHILEVMGTKVEPWSIAELMNHPELKYYAVDLSVLLEYLIEKHVIQTIKVNTKGQEIFHSYYQA